MFHYVLNMSRCAPQVQFLELGQEMVEVFISYWGSLGRPLVMSQLENEK